MATDRDTGSAAIPAIAAAAAMVLLAVLLGVGAGVAPSPGMCSAQPAPANAAHDIPSRYLHRYQASGRKSGITWNLLAAIGKVETDHGRAAGPGVHSGANDFGAAGPMQFGIGGAAGNTWGGAPRHPARQHTGGYATDGNHDGWADVYNPADAIAAAARYLKDHGAPGDVRAALFAYNHSLDYVATVLTWARRYARDGADAVAAPSTAQCQQAALGPHVTNAAAKAIAYARARLGKPYVYGAEGPDAYDCSGLTMAAYRAAGITIPRTAADQYAHGPRIPEGHERPGDLVFFAGSDGTPTQPGHVGIVTGHGHMIAAPHTGTVIQYQRYTHRADLAGFTRPSAR